MNLLLAMVAAFLWGTTYAVTQYSLDGWPPLLLGALRALPAGLLLLALRPRLPQGRQWVTLAVIGTLNIAVFFGLIFVMALTLPSAISGVGMVSVPVFAMIYHLLVYRVRPAAVQVLSGLALVGLAWCLFDPGSLSLNPIGLAAMLGAILCIVVGSGLTKSLGGRVHWWTVLSWQLVIGGVLLSGAAAVDAFWHPEHYQAVLDGFSLRNGLGLAWVILLNTALAYGLYVWLLQRMTVVEFTFGGIANPIAGIVTGLILVNEQYSPGQYALMAGMILMSLCPQLWTLWKQRRQRVIPQ
ncbi:DMT family transporter [Ferrimonas balearica]|uniref:DMT family transporter n=1 Tax=Ferrimonas balearica TaxID=44012 RepID=UPI001C59BF43|nr:EamA family transporter [Ferrimonas balearica]MBW3164109.1 EamA family transporter [Ferrimonas balearica]